MKSKRAVYALIIGLAGVLFSASNIAGNTAIAPPAQATQPQENAEPPMATDAEPALAAKQELRSSRPNLFSSAHANEVANQTLSFENDRGIPIMLIYILGALVLSMVTLSKERSGNERQRN